MGLQKLTGRITNYKKTRGDAQFFFNEADRRNMSAIAIVAAAAGLSGQAISTAANTGSLEEQADYVEFKLNGESCKGWLWRSPFKEGDQIDAVVESRDGYYELYAIARPGDKIIALYPHCSRGRKEHWINALKLWFVGTIITALLGLVLFTIATLIEGSDISFLESVTEVLVSGMAIVAPFYLLMTYSLSKKWMPFVRMAEQVFQTLGWQNSANIDLVKRSRRQRKSDDPGEYGTFFFRY